MRSATTDVAVTTRKRKRVDENDGQTKLLYPCQIKFSQSSISPTFRNGDSVRKAALALIAEDMKKREFPRTRIYEHEGTWYSLDNGRLAAFRLLRMHRPEACTVVKCQISVPKPGEWKKKISTTTQGRVVVVSRTNGLVIADTLGETTYGIELHDESFSSDSSAD